MREKNLGKLQFPLAFFTSLTRSMIHDLGKRLGAGESFCESELEGTGEIKLDREGLDRAIREGKSAIMTALVCALNPALPAQGWVPAASAIISERFSPFLSERPPDSNTSSWLKYSTEK